MAEAVESGYSTIGACVSTPDIGAIQSFFAVFPVTMSCTLAIIVPLSCTVGLVSALSVDSEIETTLNASFA